MNEYENSKIYKIICRKTGLIYIGSTRGEIELRLKTHIHNYNRWKNGKNGYVSVNKVLEHNDFTIELIEALSCQNSLELRQRERYWQDRIQCVNKNRAYATEEETKQQVRERNEANMKRYVVCEYCQVSVKYGSFSMHQRSSKHEQMKEEYEKLTPYKWKSRFIERQTEESKDQIIIYKPPPPTPNIKDPHHVFIQNKRPNLSLSSIITYTSMLKNLIRKMEKSLDYVLNNPQEVIHFLKDTNDNTKRTTLAMLVSITDNDEYREAMRECRS
jgi:hypothetical protein